MADKTQYRSNSVISEAEKWTVGIQGSVQLSLQECTLNASGLEGLILSIAISSSWDVRPEARWGIGL